MKQFVPTIDIWAGLVSASVLIPTAIAYSGIAGLPPEAGLVASIVGGLVYTLFGRTPGAIVTSTSSSAAIIATAGETFNITGVTLQSVTFFATAMAGIIFTIMALFKLGRLSNFIAISVLRGYTMGLSVLIILNRLPHIFGMTPGGLNSPFTSVWQILTHVESWHPSSIILSIIAALMLWWGKTRGSAYPVPLGVLIMGLFVNISLSAYGYGLPDIGTVSMSFEPIHILGFTELPWKSLVLYGTLIFIVLYAESSTSIALSNNTNHITPDENRDILGLGAANIVSACASGMPVGAGFSQSATSISAGAHTVWASRVASITLLISVLAFDQFVAYIPMTIISIIVISAVAGPLDGHTVKQFFAWRRDRLLVITSFVGVIVAGVADGLLFTIALSILSLLRRLANPRLAQLGQLGGSHDYVNIKRLTDAKEIPGMLIVRPDEPLFFGNALPIFTRIRRLITTRNTQNLEISTIIISMEETPDLDGTTIEVMHTFLNQMTSQNIKVYLCRVKNKPYKVLSRAKLEGLKKQQISPRSVDYVVSKLTESNTTENNATTIKLN